MRYSHDVPASVFVPGAGSRQKLPAGWYIVDVAANDLTRAAEVARPGLIEELTETSASGRAPSSHPINCAGQSQATARDVSLV